MYRTPNQQAETQQTAGRDREPETDYQNGNVRIASVALCRFGYEEILGFRGSDLILRTLECAHFAYGLHHRVIRKSCRSGAGVVGHMDNTRNSTFRLALHRQRSIKDRSTR